MSTALELRLEAERNKTLDVPCVHLLTKAADEIEHLEKHIVDRDNELIMQRRWKEEARKEVKGLKSTISELGVKI